MCDRPILGYRMPSGVVVLSKPRDYPYPGMPLPCGKCVTCKLRSRGQWTTRGLLEAKAFRDDSRQSYMVTLTYSDECIPSDLNVCKREYRLFVKRLRHEFGPRLRYQGIGEYGGQTLRPHYHFSLFGLELDDLVVYRRGGFRSATLERLWPFGQVDVILATPQTIGYVAGHQLKDLTGENQPDGRYFLVDRDNGAAVERVRPFRSQSNRPGIGETWFRRHWRDLLAPVVGKPDVGWCVVEGEPVLAPDYFIRLLRETDRAAHERFKANRMALAVSDLVRSENMPDRRSVRSAVRDGRLKHGRAPGAVYGNRSSVLVVEGLTR